MGLSRQFAGGPAGWALLSALPRSSTITHICTDAHETPVSAAGRTEPLPSWGVSFQSAWLELGAVDVATLPLSSPARHSDADGHAIERKPLGSTPLVSTHAPVPPPGLVDANTFPLLSA